MGGRIWVESEPSQGSSFHFTAALAEPEEEASREGPDIRRSLEALAANASSGFGDTPLQILLVEDNVVNQRVTASMLNKRGHEVTIAHNGREGLEHICRREFDLVLMDVQMPLMNGWEATAEIRSRERNSGSRIPIIAMTAHALPEDVDRCWEAGMDGYVSKPFQLPDLLMELKRVRPMTRLPATG